MKESLQYKALKIAIVLHLIMAVLIKKKSADFRNNLVIDISFTRTLFGPKHTDLFGLTDATKTLNSCFHNAFHASLCGEDIRLSKGLVKASVFSVFM